MEYRVDLKGDTGAATAGAAALREEGKAAQSTTTAIGALDRSVALLDRTSARAAASIRSVTSGVKDSAAYDAAARGAGVLATAWDRLNASNISKALGEEQQKLGRLKSALDAMGKGGATNVVGARALQSEIEKSSAKVGDLSTRLVRAGAAGKNFGGSALGSVTGALTKAATGLFAYGAALAGIHKLSDLTQMAIGWRGAWQLQLLSYRATMDLRRAVRGVDPQPLVRALQHVELNLSKSTVTGKALSDILTRGFNAAFNAAEGLQGAADYVIQNLVLGALQAEEAWLDLRIAVKPLGSALSELGGTISALIGPLGGAESEASPLADTMREIATASSAAADGVRALNSALSAVKSGTALTNIKQNLGMISPEEGARQRTAAGAAPSAPPPEAGGGYFGTARYKAEQAAAAAGGQGVGKAHADGAIQGLDGQGSALGAAGGRAVKAIVAGAKAEGEIHSPSGLTRREIGRPLGQGTIGGVDDMAPAVQKAGEKLIPDVSGGAGMQGGSASSGGLSVGSIQVGPFHIQSKSGSAEDMEDALMVLAPRIGQQILRELALRMGLPLPGVT